jgi:replicative DNA helicase
MADSKNTISIARSKIRSQQENLSEYIFGKVQPQAIPLEEAVLGALMLDRDALPSVMDTISPESFYVDANKTIFRAILKLFANTRPVDLLTVTDELRTMGELESIGGPQYLVQLTNKVASAANIEYHARIVAQKHIQRELIRISTSTIKEAYEDTTDVFELLDKAEQDLFGVTQDNLRRGAQSMQALSGNLFKQIEELYKNKDVNQGLTGVSTGFSKLDAITSGWQPSDLVIVAARPGMGKTSFVLALARNAAVLQQKPVAFFSLEMSSLQLANRFLSLEAEIEGRKLRNGSLTEEEWDRLTFHLERMSAAPVFIDDTPAINIFELRAKCRRLKSQHDIQLIILDYLQLMNGADDGKRSGNREQEISNISRSLKALAKELNVPVIALSQLSRAVETRGGDKRPQLSDLRESGAIEQDADLVSFIYRPEYYKIQFDENDNPTKGLAEIIIAKHRNGALDTVQLKFTEQFAKFSEMDDPFFNQLSESSGSEIDDVMTRASRINDFDNPPY